MTINILIVEDDKEMRAHFSMHVKNVINEYNKKTSLNIQCKIDECASQDDAIFLISSKKNINYYDIAIIDNILDGNGDSPEGCGSIVVDELLKKNAKQNRKCRILFCSSNTDFDKQNKALGTITTEGILDVPLELKNGPKFKLRIASYVVDACKQYI